MYFGSSRFYLLDNGDVKNEAGEIIVEGEGKIGLTKYLSVQYQELIFDGVTYYIYGDGRVFNAEWELIFEEGGIKAIISKYNSHSEMKILLTITTSRTTFYVRNDGKLVTLSGEIDLENDVWSYINMVVKNEVVIFRDWTGHHYEYYPDGHATVFGSNETISKNGLEDFIDYLFSQQGEEVVDDVVELAQRGGLMRGESNYSTPIVCLGLIASLGAAYFSLKGNKEVEQPKYARFME